MPATQTDRIGGLTTSVAVKAPVRVATTGLITLSGIQTVDGVLLQSGNGGDILPDRVLVKDQTDTTENGIYSVQASAWIRTGDFNGAFDAVQGTIVLINGGDTYAGGSFKVSSADPIVFGTSAITFTPSANFNPTSLDIALPGAPTQIEAGQRFAYLFVTPLDFGATGDGVADDTAEVQAAQDYCVAHGYTLLIPGGFTFLISAALFYDSNSFWLIRGTLLHSYTGGIQGVLVGRNYTTDGGARQSNVHITFDGGKILADTRVGPSRKLIIISFTDDWTLTNIATSGDDLGSYNIHIRDCTNGIIDGSYVDGGNSTGEDGIHFSRNCSNIAVNNMRVYSGDDAFSITHEGLSSAAYAISDIRVSNSVFKTQQNSACKLLIDVNAAGATITDIKFSNCYFGIHDGAGVGGAITISGASASFVTGINRIQFNNCSTDCQGGTIGGNSNNIVNATGVHLGNIQIFNTNARGVLFNNAYDCSIGPDATVSLPQVTATLVTGTLSTSTFVSGNTVTLTFNGSPDLSPLTAVSNLAITVTGFVDPANNGTFTVNSFDNTAKTITVSMDGNSHSAANDESGATAPATVAKRTLEHIGISGGNNIQVRGVTIDDPGTNGVSITQASSVSATNVVVENCTFKNNNVTYCMNVAGSLRGVFRNNKVINSTCRQMIMETNSAVCDNNLFENNDDTDTVHTRTSFTISRATSIDRNNRGTNVTKLSGSGSIAAGSTTTTVVVTALTFTKAFASANMTTKDLLILPTSSFGSAKNFWVTLSSRTYTVHLDTAPGSTFTFDYILNAGAST